MDSNPPDLTSDSKPACIPYTVSGFLRELSFIGNASEMSYNLDEYVRRLEEELRKIVVFKRELPLCMFLIKDAIVALKERAVQCSTSDVGLVMEEFIPLKRDCHDDEGLKLEVDCRDKKNWMSSAQLWSCDGYSNNGINYDKKHKSAEKMKESTQEDASSAANSLFRSSKHNKNGKGAVTPFKVSDFTETGKGDNEVISVPGLSLMTPGTNTRSSKPVTSGLNPKSSNGRTAPLSSANIESNVQNTTQNQLRKQRRCWSPELHRRFVTALQQLGGSRVATPKQIRELMEVDGLTNDEVKSHLQKYRIHTRRLPANASITPSHAKNVLWMPHDDQYEESSKQKVSQSGSPQGPFQLAGNAGGNSTTGGNSMEDEEDGKSESYNWKENEDNV